MAQDILDDLFHGCALEAWLMIACQSGQWPPDSEVTRRLAYQLYEQELAQRNANKSSGQHVR